MSNRSVTGESDISDLLPNVEALTEIAVGGTRFTLDPSDPSVLNGLIMFFRLHGLASASLLSPSTIALNDGFPARSLVRFRGDSTDRSYPAVTDLWFSNSRRLRFRVDPPAQQPSKTAFTWQIHQFDGEKGEIIPLASKTIDHAGLGFFDAVLRNPFLPALVTVKTSEGALIESGVLPFPSLCRGGLHYAELCALASTANVTADLAALSDSLLLRLFDLRRGAATPLVGEIGILARCLDDADAFFSADIRAWLRWLAPALRLDIEIVNEDGDIVATGKRDLATASLGGIRLDLPMASLPSIQGLLADASMASLGEDAGIADFVVAELETGQPLWSVGMPPLGADMMTLQPVGAARPFPLLRGKANAAATQISPIPFAVKFVETSPPGRKVTLLAPVSPDVRCILPSVRDGTRPRITVLIPACGRPEDGLKALVESLAQQTLSARIDIVAVVSHDDPFEALYAEDMLRHYFTGRFVMLVSPAEAALQDRLRMAGMEARGDYVLAIERTVLLHDRRTISTLMAMASHERVASASCMLVRAGLTKREMDIIFCSAGLFPIAQDESEMPEAVHPIDCQDAFPLATYPVAANPPVLHMISARALGDCGGLSGGLEGEAGFSERARRKGLLHVCTTGISAGLRIDAIPAANRRIVDKAVAHSARFPLSAGLRRLRG